VPEGWVTDDQERKSRTRRGVAAYGLAKGLFVPLGGLERAIRVQGLWLGDEGKYFPPSLPRAFGQASPV
jgi:hypothetical protein